MACCSFWSMLSTLTLLSNSTNVSVRCYEVACVGPWALGTTAGSVGIMALLVEQRKCQVVQKSGTKRPKMHTFTLLRTGAFTLNSEIGLHFDSILAALKLNWDGLSVSF